MKASKKIIMTLIMAVVVLLHIIIFIPAIANGLSIDLLSVADDMGKRIEYLDWENFCFSYFFYVPFTLTFVYYLADVVTDINAQTVSFDSHSLYWILLGVLLLTGYCANKVYWYVCEFEMEFGFEYPFLFL